MSYSHFLGFDVSKLTLNYCLYDQQRKTLTEGQIDNKVAAVKKLLSQLCSQHQVVAQQLLICCENTGLYTRHLLAIKLDVEVDIWMEDPFQLNRSGGRQRTKTDVVDARLIAEYASRFWDRADLYELPSAALAAVSQVYGLRELLVDFKRRLKTSTKERFEYDHHAQDNATLAAVVVAQLQSIKDGIKRLEQEILRLIATDERLNKLYSLVRSVPGMGKVTSVALILYTGQFKRVPTARKCASYAGISPHRRQSGSSLNVKGRTIKGHVGLKTALHQSSHCLLAGDNYFKQLYDRLKAKGHTYRQAINAVRNKLIRVVYACVLSEKPYEKKLHGKLA